MLRFFQRLSQSCALRSFVGLLLTSALLLSLPAQAENEPIEPLPVTLPASHPPLDPTGGGYVGAQSCAGCHCAEYQAGHGSQYAQAMQARHGTDRAR